MIVVLIIIVFICMPALYVVLKENEKIDEAYKSGDPEKIKEVKEELENLERMSYGKGYNIKCPNCGRLHVNHIGSIERVSSVAIFGIASDKIGKTFECPNCKYKW